MVHVYGYGFGFHSALESISRDLGGNRQPVFGGSNPD